VEVLSETVNPFHHRAVHITLDQARVLVALADQRTYQRAAVELHRTPSALVHAVRALESQVELSLVERGAYRTRLTAAGERVLEQCRRLLEAEQTLTDLCTRLRTGWEPSLRVVFDGVFPADGVLRVVRELRDEGAATRFVVSSEFLAGVEASFVREQMDAMVSVLPIATPGLLSHRLPTLRARLVVQKDHPLALTKRASPDELREHVLVTVRGSDPRLGLATAELDAASSVTLHDFSAKKAAILQGIGFGWLPEHLIAEELRRGELVPLTHVHGGVHTFAPTLHVRVGTESRPALSRLIAALRAKPKPSKKKPRA
jgi:DNA-binding transcriptional LysR family regulator